MSAGSKWRWVLRSVSVVLLALGLWLVVIPQWTQATALLPELQRIPVWMLALAVAAEAVSLLAFSAMTRLMVGSDLRFSTALRVDLADLAVNHTVPGGGSVAGAIRFGLFSRLGIPPTRALAAASVEMTASNLALGGVFLAGLLLTAGASAVSGLEALAAGAVALLVAAAVSGSWVIVRRSPWLTEVIGRWEARSRLVRRIRLRDVVLAAREQIVLLRREPARFVLCAVFAVLNWVLDALALWLVLAALGALVAPGPLLAAYGVGTILAQLPLTPGGLGLVEGVLVPAFVTFGVPADIALLGVLGWRVLQYWLPIPVGGLAALSLTGWRIPRRASSPR